MATQMLSARLDHWLAARALAGARQVSVAPAFQEVRTALGGLRVTDTAGSGPVVVFVPDGPNVVEHYDGLIRRLSSSCRVVCFDMPGFGFSLPATSYTHSLDQGAQAVLEVLDHLNIPRATLAFSCANGFYALRAARLAPDKISGLVLSQTPSLQAMHAWTARVVPAPLKIPVLGQWLGWLLRTRAAASWYRVALPRGTDASIFHDLGLNALRCGACFSLAGVVQGLLRESVTALDGVMVPCTVIWGGKDRSHRVTDPRSVLEIVPHAELITFDECGHFPDLENSARYAEILLERISRQAATPVMEKTDV
ncbi:MAG TPA: alpha/beta hydrolase [Polaromonas sp.]|uniref:alpha/beta fold hydrolase n=1 Tax=Polaromonas sp. TaxID=1869339 RepID=UPI002D6B810D|nr:alpha/beta hydrolase [Polaromonas sp.]HYW57652.1 alpha/beta hydrolase [Polaromonas sp.]